MAQKKSRSSQFTYRIIENVGESVTWLFASLRAHQQIQFLHFWTTSERRMC